jgi:hypothetical protein
MADPDWKTIIGLVTALLTLFGSYYSVVNQTIHTGNDITGSAISTPSPKEIAEITPTEIPTSDSEDTFKSSSKKTSKPYANIKSVKFSFNGEGITTHVKYDTENLADKKIKVKEYFYLADGTPLMDTNDRYSTNGQVTSYKYYTPMDDSDTCSDLQIFIPYSELHLPRNYAKYYLQLTVTIWYDGDELDNYDGVPLTLIPSY